MSARDDFSDRPATLAQYQAILSRRKWLIIVVPAIAACMAYVLSARESALYQARASVSIRTTNLAGQFVGIYGYPGDPSRMLENQAKLAGSQELASRVVAKAGIPGLSPGGFLGAASARPEADADLLNLSVSYPDPQVATQLVNVYAEQFARYKNDVDTSYVQTALNKVQASIRRLRANNHTDSSTYDDALTTRDRLQAFGGILADSAKVQSLAGGASKIRPQPKRNALIGGLLGAFLGLGLGFLAEALDRRVRSEEDIEAILGVPLLGRVPRPARRLRKANKLVMLADPASIHAQTFRRLRTSLEFVNFDQHARMIMVTSALPREGKSTTVGNLAVALARAGRRVALVDLDLRRPMLHGFFNTGSDHGFSDVVVQRVELHDALRSVALPGAGGFPPASANGRPRVVNRGINNGRAEVECVLNVLPAGTIPPAADEFLESAGIGSVLDQLRERFDVVLVDTPPLLAVGDVMALSTRMDAIVVVTRLGIHRRQLEELVRQLHACRAPVLGFILTGAAHGDSYSYGYGYDPRGYEVPREADAETTGERSA